MVGAHIPLSGDQEKILFVVRLKIRCPKGRAIRVLSLDTMIIYFIDFQEHGGEGGIRTLEGLQTLAGFQDQCIQPLCHLSGFIENVLGFTHFE